MGESLESIVKDGKLNGHFFWISNYLRLVVRYEHMLAIYQAFFYIVCIFITVK